MQFQGRFGIWCSFRNSSGLNVVSSGVVHSSDQFRIREILHCKKSRPLITGGFRMHNRFSCQAYLSQRHWLLQVSTTFWNISRTLPYAFSAKFHRLYCPQWILIMLVLLLLIWPIVIFSFDLIWYTVCHIYVNNWSLYKYHVQENHLLFIVDIQQQSWKRKKWGVGGGRGVGERVSHHCSV